MLKELQEVERLLGYASSVDHNLGSLRSKPILEVTSTLEMQGVCDMEVIAQVLPSGDGMECDVVSAKSGVSSLESYAKVPNVLGSESYPGSIKLDNGLHQHRFSSRGSSGSSLQITSSNMQRLMHGDVLSFFFFFIIQNLYQ